MTLATNQYKHMNTHREWGGNNVKPDILLAAANIRGYRLSTQINQYMDMQDGGGLARDFPQGGRQIKSANQEL